MFLKKLLIKDLIKDFLKNIYHYKEYWHTSQQGQTKTDIFSITPKIEMPTFRQKSISLRTSNNATSCGVVTIIAPVKPAFERYVDADRCSSDVPVKQVLIYYVNFSNHQISEKYYGM